MPPAHPCWWHALLYCRGLERLDGKLSRAVLRGGGHGDCPAEFNSAAIHRRHTTILNWIKDAGLDLPDAPEDSEIPEITEIDELQTFIGNKKNKVWLWTVVNHWKPGIILWTIGDRSSSSFQILWSTIKCWHSFWYVTDGWKVYPGFIEPEDHLVCKTYMTRVEERILD